MKICPECKHANSDYAETCVKCLANLKSDKKIINQEFLVEKIEQDTDFFPFSEILGVLVILYGTFLAIYGLIAIHFLDFETLIFIVLGGAILILSSEIRALRKQVGYLQKEYIIQRDHNIDKSK